MNSDNNKYVKSFKNIEPESDFEDKLMYKLKINAPKKASKFIKYKTITVTTLIICLITTTAFATVYFELDKMFLKFLNANNEQVSYISSGALAINQQIKNENGTLDIKEVIGDSNLIYILMDFTANEGVVLNADRYRFKDYFFENSTNWHSVGFTKLDDGNPNDNKISLVMSITTPEAMADTDVKLILKDLECANPPPKTLEEYNANPLASEFKTFIKGRWESNFTLDIEDLSKTYDVNKKLMIHGYESVLNSISVSPISITVKLESPYTKEIVDVYNINPIEFDKYVDCFPITINYKDGTSETATYSNGTTVSDYMTNKTVSVKIFENLVNDKNIESIKFFDVIILID